MPQVSLTEPARALKQCQNCRRPESEAKLWVCNRCQRAHYCSVECQRAHWPSHKPICRHNAEVRTRMKEGPVIRELGLSPNTLNRVLTQWIQMYRPLLTLAAYQALRLEQRPDNCFAQTLQLTISPTFTSANVPRSTRDIAHAFRLDLAVVTDVETVKSSSPMARQGFEKACAQTHEERVRNPNAIGVPVVMILVPVASTLRQVLVGAEKLDLQWDALWEENLKRHINSGDPKL